MAHSTGIHTRDLQSAVLECRKRGADSLCGGHIQFGHNHARVFASLGKHAAPRVDDHGMAPGQAPARMAPGLGSGDHRAQIFNGAGTQQELSVSLTRRTRKGCRQRQHLHALHKQTPKLLRKSQIVTNRETQSADR